MGSWFKGNPSEAVFIVDANLGSNVADLCKREFDRTGLKIKVFERSGKSIKRILVK